MSNSIRYEDFREDDSDDILEYWNPDIDIKSNLKYIFNKSVLLPEHEKQMPILIAYSFVPSAICKRLPILFLAGDAGSGKTTCTKLIAGIQGQKILSATSTFAAVRNYVAQKRWWVPEEQREEKNFCLVFDNVTLKTFEDDNLYTLFLNGYDRDSDNIQISKGNGENLIFKVFSPKVISSIHPLFSNPRLNELTRRVLPIRFKKSNFLEDFNKWYEDRINIENLSLTWLNKEFDTYWSERENIYEWMRVKKSLRKPKDFTIENWAISHDIIATGVTIGIWESKEEAYENFSDYWHWINHYMDGQGALRQLVKGYIKEQEKFWEAGQPVLLFPKDLKKHLTLWQSEGKIEITITTAMFNELMGNLGWRLAKIDPGIFEPDIYWVPIN